MRLAGERPSWSDLSERVRRVDGVACPGCGGPLTLRCVVVYPPGPAPSGPSARLTRRGSGATMRGRGAHCFYPFHSIGTPSSAR